MHQGTRRRPRQWLGAPWGGEREGKLGQREAATTEDTEGRDVTTEDASKGEWGDGFGEGGRQGRIRVWRAVQAGEEQLPGSSADWNLQGTMLTNPQGLASPVMLTLSQRPREVQEGSEQRLPSGASGRLRACLF